MADFNVTPVATQIRPMTGMSLGDMVNTAAALQAYRQAQQVNPLELQAKQMAVEQAQQMNPLAVQQAQQAARTGQINLGVAEQANRERSALQEFFSSPDNFQTDGIIDMGKINAQVPKIAPLTGPDYIQKMTGLSTAQTEARSASNNLTQNLRQLVGQTMYTLGRAGIKDKAAYTTALDDLVAQNPGNADLKKLSEAYKVTFAAVPPSDQVPDLAIKGAQQLMSIGAQQGAFAPSVTVTPEGRTVTMTPQPGAAPPRVEFGMAGGLQAPGAPAAGGPAVGGPAAPAPGGEMKLRYPVRTAETKFVPEPSEAKDLEAGQAYRDRLVTAQGTLATNRRNVEEVLQQAQKIQDQLIAPSGGLAGTIEQRIRMAISSADYDMLAKDLANMALSNTQAMGGVGNTVAGLDMQQVANGTIKVPAQVLVQIARRVQADQTNLDMQANGAQRFAERFGDNNMRTYQQAWNKNADTKIFEAMNVIRSTADAAAQRKELERLFPNASDRATFLEKYRNLKKLSETGSL